MIPIETEIPSRPTEPNPSLGSMFVRLFIVKAQSPAARTVEVFGWVDLCLGMLMFFAPGLVGSILDLPAPTPQSAGYFRLAGLLVSGLGMLYIVSGRLNAQGFVFASMLDRPLVPPTMAVLWHLKILPGQLALAFSIVDFGGFLWTLSAWRAQSLPPAPEAEGALARALSNAFAFTSGVVRNARTFHPDGRVFLGSVHALPQSHPSLARAAESLAQSRALVRMGMGLMKRGMPSSLVKWIPDAPSIAFRCFASAGGEVRLDRRRGEDLDLLCTAGGDRLWKLILNLATGGRQYGLERYDYFGNTYFAQVPYWIDEGKHDVWLRLVLARDPEVPPVAPTDSAGREQALSAAVAGGFVLRLEAQAVAEPSSPFSAFAEIRLGEEIEVDQERLHFDPVAGRGFEPHGVLTELRRYVYPASVSSRPYSASERRRRSSDGLGARLTAFFRRGPILPLEASPNRDAGSRAVHRWPVISIAVAAVLALGAACIADRFLRDQPVDYADDVMHFKHGSTGGERLMGIPYWLWVALPELFPDSLPDKIAGKGYSAFGFIYENGQDPRYALPVGASMRRYRGFDLVYLNCAVCHTGTVRDAPGAAPRVVAGMPANTFDLGGFESFLTTVALDEKFTPQGFLDEIRAMQDDPHRLVEKPDAIDRAIYQYVAVYLMREEILRLRSRLSFIHTESWGPGRVDTFNAPKALLNFRMSRADPHELVGNVDFPSIWNQGPREGMQLHWDGNNTSVNERNLSAAFGTGAYPPTLDADRVLRTATWLLTAKPPPYPYPVDTALAQRGVAVYAQYCAGCHGSREPPFRHDPPQPGERVGTVVPIETIGTDRWRLDSYTPELAVNQSTLYAGYEKDWGFDKPYPQRFSHFRKTQGYANSPLDGIWLRAPYLHNGSVPNLHELLEPSAKRSNHFYRGNDVYDTANVGFVADVAEEGGRHFFAFDTTQVGNGNAGHEGPAFGTELPAEEKQALVEFLKTF